MHGMIVDWIGFNAHNTPDRTATVELPSGRTQTYGQMNDRVGRVAHWLQSIGVKSIELHTNNPEKAAILVLRFG